MVKKIVTLGIIIFFVAGSFGLAEAQEANAIDKLGRGISNVATGWLEIPIEMGNQLETKGDIAAFFSGPLMGVTKAIGRTLAGVYEIATFPIPIPRKYKPLVRPEFLYGEEEIER